MRSTFVVRVAALVLLGCGEAPRPEAARQTPTSSPTVSPAPESVRASGELQHFLLEHTQDKRCEYNDGPSGGYLLFRTNVEMNAHFAALKQQGALVRDSPSGNDFWTRDGQDEGELVVRELGQLVTLTWTDDSERVIGSIRSKRVSTRMLCALWEENA